MVNKNILVLWCPFSTCFNITNQIQRLAKPYSLMPQFSHQFLQELRSLVGRAASPRKRRLLTFVAGSVRLASTVASFQRQRQRSVDGNRRQGRHLLGSRRRRSQVASRQGRFFFLQDVFVFSRRRRCRHHQISLILQPRQ